MKKDKKDIYDYYLKVDKRTIDIMKYGIKEYETQVKLFGKPKKFLVRIDKNKIEKI